MFGLRRCISAAKVTNLFTTTGYLPPTTHPCPKFLSSETDLDVFRSKALFIRSKAFLESSKDPGILIQEVCGTDYIPKIHFRGKKSILVELRSSEEAKLLVENGEEGQVRIGDHIFWIDPSLTKTERYTERCSKRVIIQGIPESISDDKEENKEHSRKAVEIILNQLGSKCQVEFVRPMGTKMANKSRWVVVGLPSKKDAQSLLKDGKVKKLKIGEHTMHINPFLPNKSSNGINAMNKL